jgi:RNA polymerase sigma factor (sigma-70 family)
LGKKITQAKKYQEIWNLSIDSIFDEEGNQDKCIYLADNTTIEEETSDEVDRLREVVSRMTEKKQRVYELHFLEGYSLTEVAAIMRTSIPSVHKHKEKILKFIKRKFQERLKKIKNSLPSTCKAMDLQIRREAQEDGYKA